MKDDQHRGTGFFLDREHIRQNIDDIVISWTPAWPPPLISKTTAKAIYIDPREGREGSDIIRNMIIKRHLVHAKVVSWRVGGVVGGHKLLGKVQPRVLSDLNGTILLRNTCALIKAKVNEKEIEFESLVLAIRINTSTNIAYWAN